MLSELSESINEAPKSSVVVCTRNRGSSAAKAIASLLSSDIHRMQVMLIDQSTSDDTRIAIDKFLQDQRFEYVRSTQVGTGRARNMALQMARGEFVLYTDDDCEVARDWVQVMESCLEENDQVAVVFSNVLAAPFDKSAGFVPTYIRKSDALVTSLRKKCRARGIGAGMAVRRQAVMDIGGFDPRLGPGTDFPDCEDGDIAVRALLNGWWVYETSRTHVVHDGFRTWAQGRELTRRNWRGIGAAYAKPLRCGYWRFAMVVAYEAFWVALLKPLRELSHLRRPRGVRGFFFFWQGFWAGLRAPIDRGAIRYLDEGEIPCGHSSSRQPGRTLDDLGSGVDGV